MSVPGSWIRTGNNEEQMDEQPRIKSELQIRCETLGNILASLMGQVSQKLYAHLTVEPTDLVRLQRANAMIQFTVAITVPETIIAPGAKEPGPVFAVGAKLESPKELWSDEVPESAMTGVKEDQ